MPDQSARPSQSISTPQDTMALPTKSKNADSKSKSADTFSAPKSASAVTMKRTKSKSADRKSKSADTVPTIQFRTTKGAAFEVYADNVLCNPVLFEDAIGIRSWSVINSVPTVAIDTPADQLPLSPVHMLASTSKIHVFFREPGTGIFFERIVRNNIPYARACFALCVSKKRVVEIFGSI
jgi:hypothetical protein